MEILDLLWDLELHQQSLKKIFKESIKLENTQIFIEVENDLENKRKRLNKSKEDQSITKDKLRKLESKLKEYKLRISELDHSLYNSGSQDFKQLEILDNEKDKIKEVIDKQEIEIIELMLELEEIDRELLELEILFNETEAMYEKKKKRFKMIKDELKYKMEEEKAEIKKIEDSINPDILNRFYKIKKNKRTAIVMLKENICTGCNLQISSMQLDKLNMDTEIIFCENCGRILYK